MANGYDNTVVFQMDEVSYYVRFGFFKMFVNVNNIVVSMAANGFSIILAHWDGDLFSRWSFYGYVNF